MNQSQNERQASVFCGQIETVDDFRLGFVSNGETASSVCRTSRLKRRNRFWVRFRSIFSVYLLLIFVGCFSSGEAGGEELKYRSISEPKFESELDAAIENGLEFLAFRQNDDGSFGSENEIFGKDPGVAALCGLAFLASGSSPGRGKYGENINKVVDYLLSLSFDGSSKSVANVKASGSLFSRDVVDKNDVQTILNESDAEFAELFRSRSNVGEANDFSDESETSALNSATLIEYETANSTASNLATRRDASERLDDDLTGLIARSESVAAKPMYGHGFATLFLSECFGSSNRPDLKEKIQAAVDLIIRTQNAEGGWRYEAKRVEIADVSVTTCQISALRAAKNAGFYVPNFAIERALNYVEKCQNSDGGFRYMLIDGPSGYSRTAAALHSLQAGGKYESSKIRKGFDYLRSFGESGETTTNVGMEKTDFDGKNDPNAGDQNFDAAAESFDLSKIEYYYYGTFYAATAFWTASRDEDRKRLWFDWERRTIPRILEKQRFDGSWSSASSIDVSTAMILCALLVPRERTPFFMR